MSNTNNHHSPGTEAIHKLESLSADPESAHPDAEDILLEYLRDTGSGDVADAYEAARDRIGFQYA